MHSHSVQNNVLTSNKQQSPPSKLHITLLASSSQYPSPTKFSNKQVETLEEDSDVIVAVSILLVDFNTALL